MSSYNRVDSRRARSALVSLEASAIAARQLQSLHWPPLVPSVQKLVGWWWYPVSAFRSALEAFGTTSSCQRGGNTGRLARFVRACLSMHIFLVSERGSALSVLAFWCAPTYVLSSSSCGSAERVSRSRKGFGTAPGEGVQEPAFTGPPRPFGSPSPEGESAFSLETSALLLS